MSSTSAAVRIEGVHKRFVDKESGRSIVALRDIHLAIPTGTLCAFVGPDGAGKTTLLRLMAGLLRADAGTLDMLGVDVQRDPQQIQDRISYMPQRFGLYEDLSVQENLDLYADLHGVAAEARVQRYQRLMDMTGLARFTTRPAGKLSGGMKQKLGLACTLVRSPELLLLDEPTVGVDPLSRVELWEIVEQLRHDEQLTVIISTAYLDEAQRCAQVYVMHEGEVLAHGTPESLSQHAQGRCFTARGDSRAPGRVLQSQLLDAVDMVIDAVPLGGAVRFVLNEATAPDAAPLHAILKGARIEAEAPRLEDGFMVLMRAKLQHAAAEPRRAAPTLAARASPTPVPLAPGSAMIEVRDLVRKFDDFVAVNSTSFAVSRGEIFGLLGPNGAGKTTTFRMLCGLLPATSGFLQVAGVNLRTARADARRRIGYVSQKFSLYGNLSVLENLEFFGGAYGLRGKRLRERIDTVLEQFELRGLERTPSGHLPGGFKQRLAMAVGLLHEPDILFLDEPTSGTDPLARREFWRRITSLADTGVTIIITTHFLDEAEYCDRILIQDAGELKALGTPRDVWVQAGHSATSPLNMERAFIDIVQQSRQAEIQRNAEVAHGA
jgi:ABC-2 type transport system ATP-binding protein